MNARISIRPLPAPPLRHTENCRPSDQWLTKARQALTANRPRGASHDLVRYLGRLARFPRYLCEVLSSIVIRGRLCTSS